MDSKEIEILSENVEQTIELGKTIGSALSRGRVVAMIGKLGTGKTHFIKGLALGLEIVEADDITSPTFTLMNEYEGRLMLYHIDAYRLDNAEQLEALGFDEICSGPNVVVVEWADKVSSLLDDFDPIRINLEHRGKNHRKITISNLPENIYNLII